MIEIGSSVIAVVERVEPYGVFLARDGDTIFVPTGNLAWKPNENPLTSLLLMLSYVFLSNWRRK